MMISLFHMLGDVDPDPQSLLEEPETTRMSNSVVQRKKDVPAFLYKYLC